MSTFRGKDPRTGEPSKRTFKDSTPEEIRDLVSGAETAFQEFGRIPGKERAVSLRSIAGSLEEASARLIKVTDRETALGRNRLKGEMKRTCNQFRSFADLIEEGSYIEAVIDTGDARRFPSPKPDLRRILIPVGPVAILGASNFPYAFGIVGGDTASALASGCPVVAKGHPSHPETSELLTEIVRSALDECGLPSGVFSLLQGAGEDVGRNLISDPGIKAASFTGSKKGGTELFKVASLREEPIPFYAEMGSINPVVVTREALSEDPLAIALRISGAVVHGAGQLCTKPGLILLEDCPEAPVFSDALNERMTTSTCHPLLNDRITGNLESGIERILGIENISILQGEVDENSSCRFGSTVVSTTSGVFRDNPDLRKELFGPVTLIVRCTDRKDLIKTLSMLEGQLTGTVFFPGDSEGDISSIIEVLTEKAGRVIMNGVPIGVEVNHSMVHGGPFPATTAPWTTSVGMMAIKRWLRPVVYQDLDERYLPDELKDDNPSGIMRIVDGKYSREALPTK